MRWLVLVTLLWAFSFSLIGEFLAGEVDGYIAVFSRMVLAILVFIPFIRFNKIQPFMALKLMMIGAVQIGLMYLFLYHSFLFLSVPEVLLFTIFTPVYVSLLDDLIFVRQFRWHWFWPAVLSVIGAAIIRYQSPSQNFWFGLLLVQAANICFAFGQVAYRRLADTNLQSQRQHFVFFFLGALILTGTTAIIFADWAKIPDNTLQYGVILWLGVAASGLGYFLWNYGAKQVNTGQLATMNNALIPLGLLVNFLFWSHNLYWPTLILGGCVIAVSVIWSSRKPKSLSNSQ
ncbi:MAG: DMT family transporter [Gammaproteobacteria bacterium]|nr:DMT family transporter [Gammaproteobacteria bacterium]